MLRQFAHPVACLDVAAQSLKPVKLLTPCKRTQHCWMLHVASVCTPCCMFGCCRAKFETGLTLSPVQTDSTLLANNSNIVASCCVRFHDVPLRLLKTEDSNVFLQTDQKHS